MKRSESSKRKVSVANNTRKTQKTISSFFGKLEKGDVQESDSAASEPVDNAFSDKKRRITEDAECQKLQAKIKKCSSTLDVGDAKRSLQANDATDNSLISDNVSKAVNNQFAKAISCGNETKENQFKKGMNKLEKELDVERQDSGILLYDNTSSAKCKAHALKNSQDINVISQQSEQIAESTRTDSYSLQDQFDSLSDIGILDDYELNESFSQNWSVDVPLDLSSFQRCKVISIAKEQKINTLTVQHVSSEATAKVVCSGFWKNVELEEGHIVVVQAGKESEQWVINNNNGFLVTKPDTLIAGTTITGGLFCSRRAVLSEKFRRVESLPCYVSDSSALIVGSLLHELLQKALCQDISKISDVTKLLNEILQSRETTDRLYASGMSLDNCTQQMTTYVANVYEFIEHYIKGKKQNSIDSIKDNFRGRITHVRDIEENIWLPELGLKGKIDVTVEVNINLRRKVMPLEIKTGRPSFSLEHKGQLILYTMMMALSGLDVDSGLLLYLKGNQMQEIRSGYPEKRDLILLRNTLAKYLSKRSIEEFQNGNTEEENWQPLQLPEPIHHHNACSACPYNSLCCAYLTKDDSIQLSESHPLTAVSKVMLENIKPSHIDYVIKWVSLLEMEETTNDSHMLKYIWTQSPQEREAKGSCIHNLKVTGKVVEQKSRYRHTFVRANEGKSITSDSILFTDISENDYIIVSTDTRINISSGHVTCLKENCIIVLLDRDVTKRNVHATYHIDKYHSSGLSSFGYANVGGLLCNDEIARKLRDIFIDKKPATFGKIPRSVVSIGSKIFQRLNENQQRAILRAVTAKEYVLIKGMPGTGKTQTLVALIELLSEMGASVLVTAHTHSAVDNILVKLLDLNLDFLRLGSSALISPLLKHKSEEHVTADCNTPESLHSVYCSKNIVGVTCIGSYHPLFVKRTFDVCIVDESTQVLQPIILRPLYSARKFILAGDPHQLPPVVRNKHARKLGADESLFVRLDNKNNTISLRKQYRMNRIIMNLANDLTYCNQLEAANEIVENATLTINSEILNSHEKWIQTTLSKELDESVIVVNTGSTANLKMDHKFEKKQFESDQMYCNIWEVAVVSRLIHVLLQSGNNPENIGIIAPYISHVMLMKQLIEKIEINTVDQYQGRDKEIIIYSCARSVPLECDKKRDFEILEDHRRLTVAITRAKHKLIIIADKNTMMQYTPFKKLFSFTKETNIVNLVDGCDGFNWKKILELL